MLVEPRGVPGAMVKVDAISANLVSKVARHEDEFVARVLESLNELEFGSLLGGLSDRLHKSGLIGERLVLDLDVRRGADNLELSSHKEAEGAVSPGEVVEEVRVLGGTAVNDGAVGQNNI